ncbi:unnamed protein product [Wuchereria bancrofti]|uniref:Uncharacterized protein n=1 Tax=Wuchereria bancrofti TaxID=6293 RepID=A0A3P7DXT8_WUCBA|nr:unnamed protein product [Wuchereria bancrofti]
MAGRGATAKARHNLVQALAWVLVQQVAVGHLDAHVDYVLAGSAGEAYGRSAVGFRHLAAGVFFAVGGFLLVHGRPRHILLALHGGAVDDTAAERLGLCTSLGTVLKCPQHVVYFGKRKGHSLALDGQCGAQVSARRPLSRSAVALLDPVLDPGVHLGLKPGHGLASDRDGRREITRCGHFVEGRRREPHPGEHLRAADQSGG